MGLKRAWRRLVSELRPSKAAADWVASWWESPSVESLAWLGKRAQIQALEMALMSLCLERALAEGGAVARNQWAAWMAGPPSMDRTVLLWMGAAMLSTRSNISGIKAIRRSDSLLKACHRLWGERSWEGSAREWGDKMRSELMGQWREAMPGGDGARMALALGWVIAKERALEEIERFWGAPLLSQALRDSQKELDNWSAQRAGELSPEWLEKPRWIMAHRMDVGPCGKGWGLLNAARHCCLMTTSEEQEKADASSLRRLAQQALSKMLRDRHGEALCWELANQNDWRSILTLGEAGLLDLERKGPDGKTAAQLAVGKGRALVYRSLLALGADVTSRAPKARKSAAQRGARLMRKDMSERLVAAQEKAELHAHASEIKKEKQAPSKPEESHPEPRAKRPRL